VIPALASLGPLDSVFVAAHEGEAQFSCAARLLDEQCRGLRSLVITLFRAPGEEPWPHNVSIGMPDAPRRDPSYDSHSAMVYGRGEADDGCLAEAVRILDEVFRRTQARHIYLPLGVGGHVDHRLVQEAGLRALPPHGVRDVFFYEERPDALVPGAVRVRLGQLGARLPPYATPVAREGGLARFLYRYNTVPHRREALGGLSERLRATRLAARAWREASVWQPLRAFGPRLQPLLHPAQLEDLAPIRETARRFDVGRGAPPGSLERLLALGVAYARRLGGSQHVERYWLQLPAREDDVVVAARPSMTRSA
jgi:LmbE family N-acetylglucosaminyl deacetylase